MTQEERKQKQKERNRRFQEAHPDYHKTRSRAWREANPARAKELVNRWHKINRERVKKYHRGWYEENKGRVKESSREWIRANPERARASRRKWHEANRECARLSARIRKANKRSNGGSFTRAEWKTLCAHYENKCLCCGVGGIMSIDHVIPLSRGGTNDIGNLQPLCLTCNKHKHTDSTDYRDRKEIHHARQRALPLELA